ncbi:type II secretion system F family protein [Terribacillus sp. DMT04]|uniref:type II secretion system F family protein n=1 Tax=Terribacillus sp. DMT04 TaxID=2850441 RepID=UPI001C2C25B6|nr:type II secretion system F family protein [Terribacillus sp. DMT04]QXE00564.1 type II secretion system F family protein [Terribacillus sp. DMT04]
MHYFQYNARDMLGKAKRGKVQAENRSEALEKLQSQQLIVFELRELNRTLNKELSFGKRVKKKEFIIFLRQLSTLIEAGVSLVEATGLLQEQTKDKFLKDTLKYVRIDLVEGVRFSHSVEKHPKIFPELFVNMIRAGEASGELDDVLNKMAVYYEKQYDMRQKVITAMSYPVLVGFVAVAICVALLVVVFPQFTGMFSTMNAELPAYTAFVLRLSETMQKYWYLGALLLLLCFILYRIIVVRPTGKLFLDTLKLKIPVLGSFYQKAILARMTRTVSSLLESSVPILDTLQISGRVIQNTVMEQVMQECYKAIEKGDSLAGPMEAHWAFPPMVTQMIRVGEKSGSLDSLLQRAANFYEQELDYAAERLKALLEPVLILVLSVMVGGIVTAVILPMFSLYENL